MLADMETTQSTQQQPPPQIQRPRLERLRSDRVIAGVASGLARHLGIDAAWVRIGFVVITLFGGAGVLAYLIGWIAIPEEGESESVLTTKTRSNSHLGSWVGLGLIGLAVMILIGNTGLIDGDIVFAGGLIVLGILLYRGDLGEFGKRRTHDGVEVQPPLSAATQSYEETPVDTASLSLDEMPTVAPPTEPPVAPPPPAPAFRPRPPRPRYSSVLGRLAFASLLIVVGVMGVGQSLGWWDPLARHYAGAVLVVLGAALLVGSLFGRARWLIALGVVISPLLFGAAILDVPIEGGMGSPVHSPSTVAELSPEYRLVGGEMIIDLTDLELATGETYQMEASVAFGTLKILVPDTLGVSVAAEVDAGQIVVDGANVEEGLNLDSSKVYEGTGMIDIDAHVGFGEFDIYEVENRP